MFKGIFGQLHSATKSDFSVARHFLTVINKFDAAKSALKLADKQKFFLIAIMIQKNIVNSAYRLIALRRTKFTKYFGINTLCACHCVEAKKR